MKAVTTATTSSLLSLSPLEGCLTQYGMLQEIACSLTSVELFRLATVSRTAWLCIKTVKAWHTFNKKTVCDGYGVRYRAEKIRPQVLSQLNGYTYDTPIDDCGATSKVHVETRPCVSCNRAVCDECRIHTTYCSELRVYPVLFGDYDQDASSTQPHYVVAHAFLNTKGLVLEQTQHVIGKERARACHDNGTIVRRNMNDQPHWSTIDFSNRLPRGVVYLDVASVLDMGLTDLERRSPLCPGIAERISRRRRNSYPGCAVANRNLLDGLEGSRTDAVKSWEEPCRCTLRARYLDRWLCVPCYVQEVEEDKVHWETFKRDACICGQKYSQSIPRVVMCSWCGYGAANYRP